jgi:hypothetical protein
MQLGLTIPLQKFLKLKQPPYGELIDPFFCWELHRIKHQGRSTFVAVNANNRFTLIFVGMRAADWKHLDTLVIDGLEQALLVEEYSSLQIVTYLSAAGEPEFTKTHGRKPVAGLNRMVENLWWDDNPVDSGQLFQPQLSRDMNHFLCHASGFEDYGKPWEFFREDMLRLGIVEGAKMLPFVHPIK